MAILFDKHPIVLDKYMATIIGLNEAIVLQQVHYWIEINKKKGRNFHKGRYWTYNTYEEWNEQFPFWSKETIKRTFRNLRNMKLIIVDRFNAYQMDRTLWYTIDYDRLNSIMKGSNSSNYNNENNTMDEKQSNPMYKVNLTPPIPDNNPGISKENSCPSISEDKQTDGLVCPSTAEKLNYKEIISQCSLENIPKTYRDSVSKAIFLLVNDINNHNNIKIGSILVPQDIAKEEMKKLNSLIIEHALDKFKKSAKTTNIKNPIGYLKTLIYNAISEINIDIDAEVGYNMFRSC